MIAAIVVLAGAIVVLAVVVGALVVQAQREREKWTAERRALVDRAIARHSGEVIAFDRAAHKGEPDKKPAPVLIEGLS
jgi:NADH:ubiquinone oxidoreductase subunit 6 (subunit J)